MLKQIILAAAATAALSLSAQAQQADPGCADHPNGRAYYAMHCDLLDPSTAIPESQRYWDPNATSAPVNALPGVPRWDVEKNCHRSTNGNVPPPTLVNMCINTEQASYNLLKQIWADVRPGHDRDWCINVSGQPISVMIMPYTALKGCALSTLHKQQVNNTMSRSQPFHY